MSEYYKFFQNKKCEYFPCHKGIPEEDFNCLFCYCPLYTLGKSCGGNCEYLKNGIKSCINCGFPHHRKNYDKVTGRFQEIAAVMAMQRIIRLLRMQNIYCLPILPLLISRHLPVQRYSISSLRNTGRGIMYRMDTGHPNRIFMMAGIIRIGRERYLPARNATGNWSSTRRRLFFIKN